MKIPRKKFIVLVNGEVAILRQGPEVQMRKAAEDYARLRARAVTVDSDGDFIVDLDQATLPLEERKAQLEGSKPEKKR